MKELQSSVFMTMVGVEYVPIAKALSFIIVIPVVFFYSYCVDKYTNRVLLGYSLLLVGLLGAVFTIICGHETIGLYNKCKNTMRITGWLFYWYIDAFFPLFVSTFWAFTNSLHNTDEAKKSYSFFVTSSKLGGMCAALLGYFFSKSFVFNITDVTRTQSLMSVSVFCIVLSGILVLCFGSQKQLLKPLDVSNLPQKKYNKKDKKIDVLDGLKILIRKPYTLGIFATVFCFEIVNQIINYQRLIFNDVAAASNLGDLNSMLFGQIFFTHACGLVISIIGTTFFLNVLGIRKSLVLVPVFIFALVMGFLITKSARELMIAYTGVHVLSYALAYPLRENLYVITSRDIKFKVKAWIDSIGAKSAKLSGQGVNKFLVDIGAKYGINAFNHWTAAIFVVIIAVWIFVAVLLGKKYHSSVQKGEIIE